MQLDNILNHCPVLELVSVIAGKSLLGSELVKFSQPRDETLGRSWEQTLLGSMFSASVVVPPGGRSHYFLQNPSSGSIKTQADHAQSSTKMLCAHLTNIWRALFRFSPRTRHLALTWLGRCLENNGGRRSEMAQHAG